MARIVWAAVLLAALLAAAPRTVTLVSEGGSPVVGARVLLQEAGGRSLIERTDARGRFSIPDGFRAMRVIVVTMNGESADLAIEDGVAEVRLPQTPPVIASVSVATGSAQTLHSLPLPASVLSAAEIRNSPATTTDAVLRALPGFDRNRSNSAFTNYGQLRVSFEGAGNDRGLVLVNGIPAQDGFGGQIDWAAYPGEDLTRAELLRGSGSALYGTTASGGVLELHTVTPDDRNKNLRAAVAFGNVSLQGQSFSYATPISGKAAVSVSAARHLRSYSDIPGDSSSAVDYPARSYNAMGSIRVAYAPRAGVQLRAGIRNAYDAQDQGRPNYWFGRHQTEFDAHALFDSASSSTRIDAYRRNGTVINVADRFPAQPGILRYTQFVPATEAGAVATWTTQTTSGTFTARADTRHVHGDVTQNDATGEFQNGGSGTQRLSGIALQDAMVWRRGELLASARFDSVTLSNGALRTAAATMNLPMSTSEAISPSIALRYDLNRTTALRASSSGGFRAPFLNELVRGFVIGSVTYRPNPDLQPERSLTDQLGIDMLTAKTHASVDLSLTAVNNAIGFRTLDTTHQQRANFEHARSTAAIATFVRQLGGCGVMSGWATVQRAVISSGPPGTAGKRLAFVPDSAAYVALNGRRLGASLSYTGEAYADDLNQEPLGRALLAGLNAVVPLNPTTDIRIAGDNLLGAHYRSSVDRLAPPAQVEIMLSLHANSQGECPR